MTFERTELVKHYMRTHSIGLPQAIEKVKNMTDEEVKQKREEIAAHTHHNRKNR